MRYIGMNLDEFGQRHAHHLTSDDFQPGSWRVDRFSEVCPENDVLKDYEVRGRQERACESTLHVWDTALARVT